MSLNESLQNAAMGEDPLAALSASTTHSSRPREIEQGGEAPHAARRLLRWRLCTRNRTLAEDLVISLQCWSNITRSWQQPTIDLRSE